MGARRAHPARLLVGGAGTLICATGCHVAIDASTASNAPPPQYAPIYTTGPVPIPGEKLEVPFVTGTNGQPVLVPSVAPGSVVTFPSPDVQLPARILLRQRPADGVSVAPPGPTSRITPRAVRSKSGTGVGFEVPQLPRGFYDAWYVGGHPTARAAAEPRTTPADAKASQSFTFEVKPQLRAVKAVVHGAPGADLDVVIGVAGPSTGHPIPITLSGFNGAVGLSPKQLDHASTDPDGLAHFKLHIASEGDVYVAAKSPGFAATVVRVVGGVEHPLRDARLQPGDALLCQGNGIISPVIQQGERAELVSPNPDGRPWYSHVAIYLGKGDAETAEMLWDGLIKHKLDDTLNGCTTVDVYRKVGITPPEQHRVVDSVRSYGWRPYAFGQIGVLGLARSIGLIQAAKARAEHDAERRWWRAFWDGFKLLGETALEAAETAGLLLAVSEVDALEAGKEMMICSELAAWAYQDASVKLDVAPWWPDVKRQGLLNSAYGPMDYTAPNMISHSPDMAFRFQLWPAVAPSVAIVGGQIQITEDVEFDTDRATILKDSEDVLREVATTLVSHGEIKNVRVEGHTDDVGDDTYNKNLSQRRADAVVKWLAAHRIDAARLKGVGVGEERFLVPNTSEANRHRNRRVEFHIEDAHAKP
jgi:outer membrane protein OmpA-like peptidoglycan-associated protein